MQTSMVSMSTHGVEKRKGMHDATQHPEIPPKWLHPHKASWASDVTAQLQTFKGHQMWQSLELERLTWKIKHRSKRA